jgi:hypothetical protein
MAALWAFAAYGAYDGDNSGDDNAGGDVGNYDFVGSNNLGSYGGGSYGGGSYGFGYDGSYSQGLCSDDVAAGQCMYCDSTGSLTSLDCEEVKDDGECDASCNSANCSWDGMDCFHDDK